MNFKWQTIIPTISLLLASTYGSGSYGSGNYNGVGAAATPAAPVIAIGPVVLPVTGGKRSSAP